MQPYKVPFRAAEIEFIEKKSRFISSIAPVSSESEALEFLSTVRKKHREASHNVYAYRINRDNTCRHSDDGEPSGTAGMPLLDVFLKQDIYDFCCVATRYYGGVQLGAGGLVRAYSRCGTAVLEVTDVKVVQETALCSAVLPYSLYELARRLLAAENAEVCSEDFGANVKLTFTIIVEKLPSLQSSLTNLMSGAFDICVEKTYMG